ncbi:MAG: ABC transporter permease subunit [Trueperaceae bacterium]
MATPDPPERIPFYRNVKTIGLLAQIVFAVVIAVGLLILWNNVTSALARSNLPADFSWLGIRAGIPIAERPIPYDISDPYWRAMLIGFLNTLKIAVVGVVLASIIGVAVGVSRIAPNWLLRQLSTWYVELLRNTPLAVQIIFWYTAALATLPPTISAPVTLPGGLLFSNRGLAFPFLYPGFGFSVFLAFVAVGLVAFFAVLRVRRRQIEKAEHPGRAWPAAWAVLLVVGGAGYLIADTIVTPPERLTVEFEIERGRGATYLDENGDGERATRSGEREPLVGYVPVTVRIEEGVLDTRSRNLVEQRQVKASLIRFPLLLDGEYDSVALSFPNQEAAERFDVHWFQEPYNGLIYEDRNDDGVWQEGEELGDDGSGFTNVRVQMRVVGFERQVVTDRDGRFRVPGFDPVGELEAEAEGGGVGLGPAALFGTPGEAEEVDEDAAVLSGDAEWHASGPLVYSRPTVPVSNYEGGFRFTPSYLALLLALVIYTSSFIAEIVRGGLQAVPKGQTEAAHALGLGPQQTFSLVVFPQAVRIILPPMISQFLNLTKNSSLAPLAAYTEIFAVSTIVANQTGASVPVTIMIIAAYLFISFVFAFVLNIVNARLAIVER